MVKISYRYLNSLQKKGFLLVEMLGALLLLGVLSIIVARYQGSIAQWNRQTHDYLLAVYAAEDSYDRLMLSDNQQEDACCAVGSFHVERILKNFVIPNQWTQQGFTAQRLKKYRVIQVKVSWVTMEGKSKAIVFESLGPVGY